ncbi:MAG: response regulator [Deltaproteobacteria bacterium]|nr:response regulator [Deltaproteobacteria bacterium]
MSDDAAPDATVPDEAVPDEAVPDGAFPDDAVPRPGLRSTRRRRDMDDGRPTVIIVDDSVANLRIAKNALPKSYDVFTAPSAAKMFDLLERNRPRLILLDVNMPEMDGYGALRALKGRPETADIPVVFLTAQSDPESELEGLSLGAVDYISKPFVPELLRKRVELHITVDSQKRRLEIQKEQLERQRAELQRFNANLQGMVEEKTGKILELQGVVLKTVADLVESRDGQTGGHVGRTKRWLKILIDGLDDLGLYCDQRAEWDVDLVLQSSQLHDVGKIAIADGLLRKPGGLTPEEFAEMKLHTTIGVRIIERIESEASDSEFLRYAKLIAGSHHERWDGSGYPRGLAGEGIPLLGRLMAIADVYDALTAERPYKEAFPHARAVAIILEGRGSHFDPVLVDVFELVAPRLEADGGPAGLTSR